MIEQLLQKRSKRTNTYTRDESRICQWLHGVISLWKSGGTRRTSQHTVAENQTGASHNTLFMGYFLDKTLICARRQLHGEHQGPRFACSQRAVANPWIRLISGAGSCNDVRLMKTGLTTWTQTWTIAGIPNIMLDS